MVVSQCPPAGSEVCVVIMQPLTIMQLLTTIANENIRHIIIHALSSLSRLHFLLAHPPADPQENLYSMTGPFGYPG